MRTSDHWLTRVDPDARAICFPDCNAELHHERAKTVRVKPVPIDCPTKITGDRYEPLCSPRFVPLVRIHQMRPSSGESITLHISAGPPAARARYTRHKTEI